MSARVIRLLPGGDPDKGMEPSEMIARASFLGDDTSETVHTPFTNSQGNVTAGVWECAPFKESYDPYGVDEICVVLGGSVTVTDDDGYSETFGPGDSFVMPKDFKGIWHVTETLRKFWMIVEPQE